MFVSSSEFLHRALIDSHCNHVCNPYKRDELSSYNRKLSQSARVVNCASCTPRTSIFAFVFNGIVESTDLPFLQHPQSIILPNNDQTHFEFLLRSELFYVVRTCILIYTNYYTMYLYNMYVFTLHILNIGITSSQIMFVERRSYFTA